MREPTLKKHKYSRDLIGSAESRKPGRYTSTPAYKVLEVRRKKEADRKKYRQEEDRIYRKSKQRKIDMQRAVKHRLRIMREAKPQIKGK